MADDNRADGGRDGSTALPHGTGRLSSGVLHGTAVAFGTFCVLVALNFVRVNLFLDQLTVRPDWHNMISRFRAERSESLRLFVNLTYLKGTPLKILVASIFGAVIGGLGGFAGWLSRVSVSEAE